MIKRIAQNKLHKVANTFGILFAVLSAFLFWFLAWSYQGQNPITPIEVTIFSLYPLGLIIGLKWKGFGGLICIAGFFAALIIMIIEYGFFDLKSDFKFFIILSVIQMIPITLYILSWHYHRQSKAN